MYREKIKVLDCTIRDGGLINNHFFEKKFVKTVYTALAASGVDYIELGYKNSKTLLSDKEFGMWKFCEDDLIKEMKDDVETDIKVSVMADVGRLSIDEFRPVSESPIDMVRVATYVKDIDKAIATANDLDSLGYETTINIMAISKDRGHELDEALQQIEEECRAGVIYIVDSFGSLYQEPVEILVKKFKDILKTKEIGMHAHNNLQLGFSNTIEAIIHGANYLDGTVFGIGRGAGNCPLELLVGFLKNPKFDIRPILELISGEFLPLRQEIEWGYILPYAITGMFNEHPRTAIALRKSEEKDSYRKFYEDISGSVS